MILFDFDKTSPNYRFLSIILSDELWGHYIRQYSPLRIVRVLIALYQNTLIVTLPEYCPFCGTDLYKFYKSDEYANEIEGKTLKL
jgi:hypothetical protein